MTRINTNVSSLVAQNILNRTNEQLETSLTRLSTGLRINSGRDDPAGLIASEILRSDIVSTEKAISNSQRANQVIATADSALGQVSSLLNDIRGLVTESANTGALSDEQIEANQLQLDSALEAINRISQTTTFQGQQLLDGSLDFTTTAGLNFSTVEDLNIQQAFLGQSGSVDVDIEVNSAATQASLTATGGFEVADFAEAQLTFAAELNIDNTNFASNAELYIQATTPGSTYDGATVTFDLQNALGAGNETAVYDSGTNTLTITVDDTDPTTAGDIAAAVNTQVTEFAASTGGNDAEAVTAAEADALDSTVVSDFLTITSAASGPDFNNVAVQVETDNTVPAGTPTAVYDTVNEVLTITVNDTADTTLADIVTAFAAVTEFSAVASATAADESVNVANAFTGDIAATANTGETGGGTLLDDLVFELSGLSGAEIFNFGSAATITDIEDAVNLQSDSTGVSASVSGSTLTFASSEYGSKEFVSVQVINEGTNGIFENGLSATRVNGTDISAIVNGVTANADGNTLSINTSTLDLDLTVADGTSADIGFSITGGGALFQLGPEVVGNQQARIGIGSVNTARLGGTSGLLYTLGTGGTAALNGDTTTAASIVQEAISEVTSLRGRLGAFQQTTLDSNINALNDTLANLTDAESQIRDADFASESANLTRSQILVQSGTSVLAIANSNPQNVLALLR